MKNLKALPVPIGLACFITFLSSCELDFDVPCFCSGDVKPIEKGLKTTVSGKAFDYNLQKPIANVKVYLEHIENVGYRKSTYIDSAFTDSNGLYSFSFTTDGVAVSYYLIFHPTPRGHYETYSYEYQIHNYGNTEIIYFNAARMNIALLNLHVVDNPNPPLLVRTHQGFFAQKIAGINFDTTVWLFVMPNIVNSITFSIHNPDTLFLINYQVDKINLIGNFQDTVHKEFTVKPKEFKLRRSG